MGPWHQDRIVRRYQILVLTTEYRHWLVGSKEYRRNIWRKYVTVHRKPSTMVFARRACRDSVSNQKSSWQACIITDLEKIQKLMKSTGNHIVRTHIPAVNSILIMPDAENKNCFFFQKINMFKILKKILTKIPIHRRPWSCKMSCQTNLWGRGTKMKLPAHMKSQFPQRVIDIGLLDPEKNKETSRKSLF